MRAIVPIVLVGLLYGISSAPIKASRMCASRKKAIENISLKQNSGDTLEVVSNESNPVSLQRDDDIKFKSCNNFCYALWQEEKTANGSEVTILLQGCWKQSGEQKCENTECVALQRSTKALNNTKFCCCQGDYCNVNITNAPDFHIDNNLPQTIPPATESLDQSQSERWILIGGITLLICITAIVYIVYKFCRNKLLGRLGKPLSYSEQLMESTALRTGTYTVDHLKLTTFVGQGRYGSVWQGSMGDQDVAVKIFPSHYRNYFQNERDTYCLPFMEHVSLLSYYGVDERVSIDGNVEYLLVLSFVPNGTLTDHLRIHTIDWASFCKMGLSVAKGLAYLHTDVRRGDKFKPCIAHRDMNSRNILVKADGSCCICDLGLAVQISGSKYYSNGEEQHAETKSINDVGTLRYMAPEVLEGAVNLRDCESSLKQIDVYAMGLVLWELVSRCSDIYVPGSEIPQYKLPFEKEIGTHPTFEQMQVLVSRHKARPLLEGNLVDRSGVRLIKETMDDCWDSDAEARLTALCIEERLMELQSHRVTMYFTDGSPMINSHCALIPSTTNSLYSEAPHHDNVHVAQLTLHVIQDAAGHDATADNLVTLSPIDSVPHEHGFKNSNEVASCNRTQMLQPYQGKNPCLERNLMLQSDSLDELECNGNILVDKSLKHVTNDQYRLPSEAQGLVSHDYLSQHTTQLAQLRPATPIPYVQNVISENGVPLYNKRKQTNMPDVCTQESPRKKKFSGWTNFKKLLVNKKMYPYSKCQIDREDSKSNLLCNKQNVQIKTVDVNVSISPGGKCVNDIIGKSSTILTGKDDKNVTSINVEKYDNDCDLSSVRPSTLPLVNLKNKRRSDNNLSRQESIEKFNEIFNSGSNQNLLKDPNMRIKTPGDLPPSVRKVRGRAQSAARFSLYDDRMMCNILSEEDDRNERIISNSVPFGMDLGDSDGKISQSKLDLKNVTCF